MITELVLFDMGGVLVELGPLPEVFGLDGADEAVIEDFWHRWLTSPTVRTFEQGRCDVGRFAADLVTDFELDLTVDQLIENFAGFPRGLFPGAADLVAETAGVTATGILSNTNAFHWDSQPDATVIEGLADHHYLSYRLGLLKPDPEIYAHIIDDFGCAADRILFLDDNQMNVDGARQAGMRAERTRGVLEARAALVTHRILT